MAGIVGSITAIGSLIPQQGVIIKRIQGVTDVVVLGVRNGVRRCGDGAVSVDFCVTTQRSSDVLIGGIELCAVNRVAAGSRGCTVSDVCDYTGSFIFSVSGAKCTTFAGVRIPEQRVVKSGIDSIQGITDIIVISISNGVRRRSDGAVCIDFGTTPQRINNITAHAVEL